MVVLSPPKIFLFNQNMNRLLPMIELAKQSQKYETIEQNKAFSKEENLGIGSPIDEKEWRI